MIQKARGEDSQSLLREIAYSCLVLPTETQAERDSDIYFLRQLSEVLKAQRATRITTTSDGRKEIKGNKDLVIDAKIVEPQPKEPQALQAPQPQAKSDKEIELESIQAKVELLREQNRAKELSIKEKELNLELKKLEVVEKSDLAKKIIDDNPLWFDQKRADVIDALGDRDRDENL